MRATMELYEDAMEYPPVHVQIVLGHEDLTVKVLRTGCGKIRGKPSFSNWCGKASCFHINYAAEWQ